MGIVGYLGSVSQTMEEIKMEKVASCGFLIYREDTDKSGKTERSFLLMRHADRWDLPKGHIDPGEKKKQCALRELEEETGITIDDIKIDTGFKFKEKYIVTDKRDPKQKKSKKLTIYLAQLIRPVEIIPTEHIGFQWTPWNPPHSIQRNSIDPLLRSLADHWR
jgi:8-oxo-dGTP pyrophosphatase MutT (NUDIX family)